MRTKLALTIAACTVFAPAAFAADLSAPAAPASSAAAAGPEVFFDGLLSATYANNSLTPWTGTVSARATVVTNSGWGASLTGIDQVSLSGVSLNVAGGQVEVFKNFGGGAVGASYAIASGSGITVSGVGLEGALFAGNAVLRGSIAHTFGGGIPETTTLSGQAGYFFAPDTKGYVGIAQTWNASATGATTFSVGAEHKFQSSPISVFADLGYTTTTSSFAATVGIRFMSGGLSLQDFGRKVPF